MKVVDTRAKNENVKFRELGIGEAYFDTGNNLCIKTSNEEYVEENCITYRGGTWYAECESTDDNVMRARVTITIE